MDRIHFAAPVTTPASRLRALCESPGLLVMPCCFDAFSARLIERAGFPLTFMSGFAVSASRLGLPDGFVEHGPRGRLLEDVGLDAASLARRAREALDRERARS